MSLPMVSILVAARNEEDNILELLESLSRLSYPPEKTQILIGNDGSTDKTAELTNAFIKDLSGSKGSIYRLINIEKKLGHLQGKPNVLAQLAHHATGEYFLFTDADVEVSVHWVEGMVALLEKPRADQKTGVVTGITLVRNHDWFEACQAIEWLFALKIMQTMANLRIPSTGMGNNMAVSKEAYQVVGGFENIAFSIVEDYAIYKAIIDKGYDYRQAYDASVMTVTKPPPNYFEQRKRWVTGGISSGSLLIFPAVLQGIALPILLIIALFCWQFSLGVVVLNLLINFWVGYRIFSELGQLRLFKYIPVYTVYMYVFWFLQLVSYALPTKLVWKGRAY